MMDDALYIGLKTNLQQILALCQAYAFFNKDIVALNLLDHHEERIDNQEEAQPR